MTNSAVIAYNHDPLCNANWSTPIGKGICSCLYRRDIGFWKPDFNPSLPLDVRCANSNAAEVIGALVALALLAIVAGVRLLPRLLDRIDGGR